MKQKLMLLSLMIFVVSIVAACPRPDPPPSDSQANVTISGVVWDFDSWAPLAGLTVTLRNAADNSPAVVATTNSDGSYSLTFAAGSTVYAHFSGTANGVKYYPTNTPIITISSNKAMGPFPVMATSSFTFTDLSVKAYLALDAFDNATYSHVSGVSLSFSPQLTALAYWNGSAYDLNRTSTTSFSRGQPPSAVGYSTTTNRVAATWTKTGASTYTAQYPLVIGEVTYDWNDAYNATTSSPGPNAPTGVTATAGNAVNTISWSSVTGATAYNLYWSTSSGVTKTNGTKIANASSPYSHTGRANGTTYYYIVTALNSYGESAPSHQVSATPAGSSTSGGDAACNSCLSSCSGIPGCTCCDKCYPYTCGMY